MTDSPVPKSTLPSKKAAAKRSPVELWLVRGGIGILVLLVVIEGWATLRMKSVHSQLLAELRQAETTDHQVTGPAVEKIFQGRQPDFTKKVRVAAGEERYDIYYYKGLLKTRELCVHYGVAGIKEEPEVVEVTTILPDEVLAN